MAATTEEVPRTYGRGTSSVVSFVLAMNRVDGVELVVDLVNLDLTLTLLKLTFAPPRQAGDLGAARPTMVTKFRITLF